MLIYPSFFVKLLLYTRKITIIIRKQKIIKRIIFTLFLLQKIKFEEIKKNYSYIIIYYYNYILLYIIIYYYNYILLYIIIYEQFFLIFLI